MLITDICSIFATASRAVWDGLFKEVRKTIKKMIYCIFPHLASLHLNFGKITSYFTTGQLASSRLSFSYTDSIIYYS